jgi:predicted dithiol-disulfide oxidoreductase (DUF899 family)
MLIGDQTITRHQVVSREEWLVARQQHLLKEKELTRLRDQLSAERRELPWVKIEKNYVFEGPKGPETLAGLFEGRSQLIVQHFMFGPDWEEGCFGCSFGADHNDSALMHIEHHDVSFVAISRAPYPKLEAYKQRMGWRFKWVSSYGSDFNYDYHVSFTPEQIAQGKVYYNYAMRDAQGEELAGTSVFYKAENGDIFHTYSAYGRGDELLIGAYNFLDLTPKGRNETGPNFDMSDWVQRHDKYEAAPVNGAHACCGSEG